MMQLLLQTTRRRTALAVEGRSVWSPLASLKALGNMKYIIIFLTAAHGLPGARSGGRNSIRTIVSFRGVAGRHDTMVSQDTDTRPLSFWPQILRDLLRLALGGATPPPRGSLLPWCRQCPLALDASLVGVAPSPFAEDTGDVGPAYPELLRQLGERVTRPASSLDFHNLFFGQFGAEATLGRGVLRDLTRRGSEEMVGVDARGVSADVGHDVPGWKHAVGKCPRDAVSLEPLPVPDDHAIAVRRRAEPRPAVGVVRDGDPSPERWVGGARASGPHGRGAGQGMERPGLSTRWHDDLVRQLAGERQLLSAGDRGRGRAVGRDNTVGR
jgi:hypothetical protein